MVGPPSSTANASSSADGGNGGEEQPPRTRRWSLPWYWRALVSFVRWATPQAVLRWAGPYGPGVVKKYVQRRFAVEMPDATASYIYEINAAPGTASSGGAATKVLLA